MLSVFTHSKQGMRVRERWIVMKMSVLGGKDGVVIASYRTREREEVRVCFKDRQGRRLNKREGERDEEGSLW